MESMKTRLAEQWARRSEITERLREDRGSSTVEVVLWTLALTTLALTVGAIIYALVVGKAKSIHF